MVIIIQDNKVCRDYSMYYLEINIFYIFFQSLYSRVPACQITTYYYVGFSYLMMRRYSDAIRSFSNILLYIQRTQRNLFQQKTYQADQVCVFKSLSYVQQSIFYRNKDFCRIFCDHRPSVS